MARKAKPATSSPPSAQDARAATATLTRIRDRVIRSDKVPASTLVAHPGNWRRHPTEQKSVLRGLLEDIGFAGTILTRELPDGTLQIIDGHLRSELATDDLVPVTVTDLNDQETDKLLATYDPIGALAQGDGAALKELTDRIGSDNGAVQTFLERLRMQADQLLAAPHDIPEEWADMPEFEQPDFGAYQLIGVRFRNKQDVDAFAQLIGQPHINEKTKSIWYPKLEIARVGHLRWKADGTVEEAVEEAVEDVDPPPAPPEDVPEPDRFSPPE